MIQIWKILGGKFILSAFIKKRRVVRDKNPSQMKNHKFIKIYIILQLKKEVQFFI